MKKALLLIPVLVASLLVGCANGNAYKPENITLDMWLDGIEKSKNNMYDVYPHSSEPTYDDANPVDWDNFIINTIKENVTSTTPKRRSTRTQRDGEEYLWYLLESDKGRAKAVMIYVCEDCIVTRADLNFAGGNYAQILEYDLEPSAGKKIIQTAKTRIADVKDSDAYETETAKKEANIQNIIERVKKEKEEPVIQYQGIKYKDTNRSFFDDLTYEECRKWTDYFKEDSKENDVGPFLFTYTIDENLMVGVDLYSHDRYVDGKEQDRYYLVVAYVYQRAFPHHEGETVTYYNLYELPKSTVLRLETRITTINK